LDSSLAKLILILRLVTEPLGLSRTSTEWRGSASGLMPLRLERFCQRHQLCGSTCCWRCLLCCCPPCACCIHCCVDCPRHRTRPRLINLLHYYIQRLLLIYCKICRCNLTRLRQMNACCRWNHNRISIPKYPISRQSACLEELQIHRNRLIGLPRPLCASNVSFA
jgi:hypothetical protein